MGDTDINMTFRYSWLLCIWGSSEWMFQWSYKIDTVVTGQGFIRATSRGFSALDCSVETDLRINKLCLCNAENELSKRRGR